MPLCPANPTWPNLRSTGMDRFRLTLLLALLAALPLLLVACGGGGGY